MNINETLIKLNDDEKIELLGKTKNKKDKVSIIKSLKSDEKKLELLKNIIGENARTEIILTLNSDEMKIQALEAKGLFNSIKSSYCISQILCSFDNDENRNHFFEKHFKKMMWTDLIGDIILSFKNDEMKMKWLERIVSLNKIFNEKFISKNQFIQIVYSLSNQENRMSFAKYLSPESAKKLMTSNTEKQSSNLENQNLNNDNSLENSENIQRIIKTNNKEKHTSQESDKTEITFNDIKKASRIRARNITK